MALPLNLILIRHGESEGNVANRCSERGDDRFYTDDFLNRHSSLWRLTDCGINQAKRAGEWVRQNIGTEFDRYYVSIYHRALETAAYLDLPKAEWRIDFRLRESDRGLLNLLPYKERLERYPEVMQVQESGLLYWTPPAGESIADLDTRARSFLDTLHRECADKNVIVVCHGNIMWAFRILIERLTPDQFHKLEREKDPFNHMQNGQILHYTRVDPRSGEISPRLDWLHSNCPWDSQYQKLGWRSIKRKIFSNSELLDYIQKTKRIINREINN